MRLTGSFLVVIVCVLGTFAYNKRATRENLQSDMALGTEVRADAVDPSQPDHSPQYAESTTIHPVQIRTPQGPPRIKLSGLDPQQRAAEVACSTCHSIRPPNSDNKTAQTLDEFHQGFEFSHGQLVCYACHNPANTDTLRLADGSQLNFTEVILLCSQCHSKQAESFAHGAHGGMNGFWDLTLGPQTKNNCIDCHDPHSPRYPQMAVTFKPKDRFNSAEDHHVQPK